MLFFLSIIFTVFWVFSFFKFRDKSYFSGCTNFENMTVLGLIIYYYIEQIIIINSAFIYSEATFWIITAFFIYIAGTFFLLLYMPSLDLAEQEKYYVLNYIFMIIRTVLLSVAIFIKQDSVKLTKIN